MMEGDKLMYAINSGFHFERLFSSKSKWDSCCHLGNMLPAFKLSSRKLRLISVAFFRHVVEKYRYTNQHVALHSFRHEEIASLAEELADGIINLVQVCNNSESDRIWIVARTCLFDDPEPMMTAENIQRLLEKKKRVRREKCWQRDLVRSMIKPFTPPPNYHYNSTTKQLAQAVYDRDLQAIAPLHDALLDQGYADLAEEYKRADLIYKGHWATDVILEK